MKCEIKKKKRIQTFIFCFFVLCLAGCGRYSSFDRSMSENTSEGDINLPEKVSEEVEENTELTEIFVHVCGCVQTPGLYCLSAGTRAGEAIEAAGGFTKKADSVAVNLAQQLEDGQQIYVPAREEKSSVQSGEEGSSSFTGSQHLVDSQDVNQKVNLNTASLQDLTALSGIGTTRAEAILAYRQENGSFSSIEDIKNVSGIGDGIFEKIKDSITV